eukprot:754898-Hanusia_phi.AAC.2
MSPEPRVGHSLCMWGTEMYIFGGGDSQAPSTPLAHLGSTAPARKRRSMTLDSERVGLAGARLRGPDASSQRAEEDAEGTDKHVEGRAEGKRVDDGAERDREMSRAGHEVDEKKTPSHLQVQGKPSSSEASKQRAQNSLASLPQRTLNSLEDKLKNRPTKASSASSPLPSAVAQTFLSLQQDLVQQNILKASTAVTPNILAAQQRLLMRQMGSTLERKLRR